MVTSWESALASGFCSLKSCVFHSSSTFPLLLEITGLFTISGDRCSCSIDSELKILEFGKGGHILIGAATKKSLFFDGLKISET